MNFSTYITFGAEGKGLQCQPVFEAFSTPKIFFEKTSLLLLTYEITSFMVFISTTGMTHTAGD
jgi:hypothetical protein